MSQLSQNSVTQTRDSGVNFMTRTYLTLHKNMLVIHFQNSRLGTMNASAAPSMQFILNFSAKENG